MKRNGFAIFIALAFVLLSNSSSAQVSETGQGTEQSEWVTNTQLYGVLNLDYEVEAQQGWLVVTDGANRFFIQANPNFPEIRIMQAWGNSVGITAEELNGLNERLTGGRLFITSENKIQLVMEHSYHGMKMNSLGLIHCIERFRNVRDAVVEMIANL